MLALYQKMMEHEEEVMKMEEEERDKGTEDLVEEGVIVNEIAENRVGDSKDIYQLTKTLHEININEDSTEAGPSTDNKRPASQEDGLSENKKSKLTEKITNSVKRNRDSE